MSKATSTQYANDIIDYYESCEIDYRLLWRLDRCLALHFGYWDDTTDGVSAALIRENEVLAERAGITKDDLVLDAGCGVGGSAIYLAKNIGCRVHGITLVQKQVETARHNANQNGVGDLCEFSRQDFCAMQFEDNSVDVVWAIEAVCHAEDKNEFVKEAFRVLKPGGRLIMADFWLSKDHYSAEENNLLQEWVSGWSVNELEKSAKFKEYLQANQFEAIQIDDVSENIRPSAKRLHDYAKFVLWGAKILEIFRIRSKTQHGNVVAVHRQYQALNQGLWHYCFVFGRKPATTQ